MTSGSSNDDFGGGPPEGTALRDLDLFARLERVELVETRPLPDVRAASDLALERFHRRWLESQVVIPTLYAVQRGAPGRYAPLGSLRRRPDYGWELIEALTEAIEVVHGATGFLLACEGIAERTRSRLFVLQGTVDDRPHYGALDIEAMRPSAEHYLTEFDLGPEGWRREKLKTRIRKG